MWSRLGVRTPGDNEEPGRGFEDIALSPTASGLSGRVSAPPATVGTTIASGSSEGSSGGVQMRSRFRPVTSLGFTQPQGERSESLEGKLREEGGGRRHDNMFGSLPAVGSAESQRFGMGLSTRSSQLGSSQVIARRGTGITPVPEDVPPTVAVFRTPSINSNLTRDMMQDSRALWEDPPGREAGESRRQGEHAHRQQEHVGPSGSVATGYGTVGAGQADAGAGTDDGLMFDSTDMDPFGAAPASPAGPGVSVTDSFASEAFSGRSSQALDAPAHPDFGFKGLSGSAGASSALESIRGGREGVGSIDRTSPASYAIASTVAATTSFDSNLQRSRLSGAATPTGASEARRASPLETLRGSTPVESFSSSTPEARTNMWQSSSPAAHTLSPALQGRYSLTSPRPEPSTSMDHRQTPSPGVGGSQQAGGFTLGSGMGAGDAARRSPYASDMSRLLQSPPVDIYSYGSPALDDIGGGDRLGGLFDRQHGTAASMSPASGAVEQRPPSATAGLHGVSEYGGSAQQEAMGMYEEEQERYEHEHECVPPPVNMEGTEVESNAGLTAEEARIDSYGLRSPFAGNQSPPALRFGFQHGVGGDGDVDSFASRPHSQPHMPLTSRSDVSNALRPSSSTATQPPHQYVPSAQTDEGTASPKTSVDYFGGSTTSSVPSPTPTQFVELRGALITGADSPMGPGSPPPGGVLGSSVRASPNSTLRSSPVASTVQHSPPLAPSTAPASESDYGSRSASRANSPPPEFTVSGGDGGDHVRSFGSDDGGSGGSSGGGGGGKYRARPTFITPEHTTSPRAPRPLASPFPPHRREPDRQQSTDFWKGAVCDTVTRSGAFDSFDESGGSSEHRGEERREAEARGYADDRRQPTLMSEPSVQAVPDDLFGTPAGVDGGWGSAYNSPMRRVLTPPPAPQRRSETPVKDASQLFGTASPEAEKSPHARAKTPVVTGLSSSAYPFNDSSGAADDVNGIFGAGFQQPDTGNLRGADACFSPTGIGGGDPFGFQSTSSFANRAASPARDMAFTAFNFSAPPPPPAPAQASYDPFGAAKLKSPGRTTEHASFRGPTSPYGNGGFGTHPPAFAQPGRSTAVKDAVRGLAGALASDEPQASGSESYFSSGDRGQEFGVSASLGSGAELERVRSPGRRLESPKPAATDFGAAVGSLSPRPGRQSFFEQPPAGLSSTHESHSTYPEATTAAFTPRDLFASSLSSTHRGAFDAPPPQEPSHFAPTGVSMGGQLAPSKTPPPYVASAVASSVVPSPPPPPPPGPVHPPDNVIAYNTSPPRSSSHLTSPRAEHPTVSSPAFTRQDPPALISPKVRTPYDPSLKLASPSLAAPARPLSPVMPAQAPSAGGTLNVVPDNIFGGEGEDVFGGDLAGEFGYNAGHNDFSAGPPGQDALRHAPPAAPDPFSDERRQDGFSYEAAHEQSFGLLAEQDAHAGFASGGQGEVRGAQQQQQQQSFTLQEPPHGDRQSHPFSHYEQDQHQQQHPFHQQPESYLSSTQQQQQQQTSYFSQPQQPQQQQPQDSYLSSPQQHSPAVPQGGYLMPQQPSHSTPQVPRPFSHPYSTPPKPTYQHPSHVSTEQHADGAVMFDMDRTPSQPQQPTGAPSWQQAALPHPLIGSPSKSPVKTLGGPTTLPLSVPHPAPRSHEGGLAFPLTGMQRSSKEERSMRRPVWAPTSFAISGKMVYMVPERARVLSVMGGLQGNDEGYKKGPLRVKKLRFDVCSYFSDDWFAKVLCIDSPLTAMRVARPRLKDFSLDPAERLLWGLVDAAARNHGQLSTGKGLGDSDSLEREILGLIVPPADHRAFARGTGTTPKKADTPKARAFEAIEKAVMEGSLEVAVKVAEDADMFADAMILSAILSGCAGEKKALQYAIRNYANRHVEPGSALHTLYIHASGQAGSALVHGGKPLAVVGPGGQQYQQQQQQQQQGGLDATVVKNWRRNLAAMYVACQTDPSAYNTLRIFGDRLKTEGMTSAAHAAYLLSGMDPGEDQASWESRFFLIGVDVDRGTEAAMWSERSVDAFLRTECWHVARRGAISKPVHYTKNTKLPLSTIKFQEYKLQFASVLADSGDIPRAKTYLESLRHVLGPWVNTSDQFANDEVNRYPRQLGSGVTSPFSVLLLKKYANLTEYFLEPAKQKSGAGTTLLSQAGSFVVSTIKKHVHAGTGDETPSSVQTPPTSSGGGVGTAGAHASHHHTMSSTDLGGSPPVPTRVVRSASYGQQTATSTLNPAFEHRPQAPPSTPPMHGSYQQQQQQQQQDVVSPGLSNGVPQVQMWNPAAVSGAPHRTGSGVTLAAYGSTDGKPPRSGEKVFSPGQPFTQWSPNASAPRVGELPGQTPLSGSGGSLDGQHHDAYSLGAPMEGGISTDGMMQDIPLNDGPGSVAAPAPFAPPHRSSSMQHLPGKIPPGIVTEHRTHAPSSDPGVRADATKEDVAAAVNKPGSRSQPTSQPSSAKSTPNHRRPSAGGAEGSQGGNKGSVLGWIGKTLGIKTPVVADVGQEMKAYFDKDKGRWVFPGEEDNPEADAVLAPPPTSMPVQGASESMASGSPMGPPPGGYGSNSAPPSFGAGPPGGGNTSSAASDDPLAALMAPPPMRGLPSRRPSGGSIPQAAVPKYNYSTFVPKPSAAYTSQLQSQSSREVEGDNGSGGIMAIPPPMHTGLPPMTPPFNTNGQPM